MGEIKLDVQKDAYNCFIVGSVNRNNVGEMVVGGIIPSTTPRLIEYVTEHMRQNNGATPDDVSHVFLYNNLTKLAKYRASITGGLFKDPGPFEWHWPTMQFSDKLPDHLEWWIRQVFDAKYGQRLPGLIVYSEHRNPGKSSFFAQMVGHEKGDNNFATNPFINYVNGFARKEDFENKLHSRLTILDDFKPWQNGEDLKNLLTAQSTGLNIKTGTVTTPPLPCILITNSNDQFKAWKADKDYQKDCVFLEVDGWFYINPSQKRTIRNCKLTQNFSSEEVLRMEVEALEQQRIDESDNQLNTADLSDDSLQTKYRTINTQCFNLFNENNDLQKQLKERKNEKSTLETKNSSFHDQLRALTVRVAVIEQEKADAEELA